jgi:syntaxin 1B/2/3
MNGNDPNRILNECRAVDQAIDEIEADLQRLKGLQSRYLADTNTSAQSPLRIEVDRTGENIMTKYRGLVSRVKNIKQQPESGNPRNAPQVGKVDRRLKTAINQYQQVEREFRKASQEQMARQYRIVRPDASDAEVREAVEDPNNQQIFSSALIQSDRRGEAQTVARNVSQRHEDIQKIERQMIELAQLFQDLEALVVQQEPAVTQIEQRGEEVTEHVAKANTELDGAVKKARAARRKKWMCLGIAGQYSLYPNPKIVLIYMQYSSSLSSLSWLSLWWRLRTRGAAITRTTVRSPQAHLSNSFRPGYGNELVSYLRIMLLVLCSKQIFFYCAVCVWESSLVEWAKRPQNIGLTCSFWESLDGFQCVLPVRNSEEVPEKGGRNAKQRKVSYVQKSRRKALVFFLCFFNCWTSLGMLYSTT